MRVSLRDSRSEGVRPVVARDPRLSGRAEPGLAAMDEAGVLTMRTGLDGTRCTWRSATPVRECRRRAGFCWEGDAVTRPVRVVGFGGSLRAGSTSLTALQVALEGAAASGAGVVLFGVRGVG